MSLPLVVNNKTFQYPDVGEEPGWGEDASAWAEEVTAVLESLFGANDIPTTAFTIANNQVSPANIAGLLFNTAAVRSATIEYAIYRTTNSNELVESGEIYILYRNAGATWEMTQMKNSNAGVSLTITNTGQFQYTSSNVSGSSYSGSIKFRAKTLIQQ